MSPIAELALVLVGLYFLEGVRWLPAGAIAFTRRPWGGYASRSAARLRDGATGGVLFPKPWVPALERFLTYAWPLAFSPAGLSLGKGSPILSWTDAESLQARGARLILFGQTIARTASPDAARRLVELLRTLARAAPEERERGIRAAVTDRFDAQRVRERLGRLQPILGSSARLSWLIAINMFVAGPVLAHFFGWAVALPLWVLAQIGLTIPAVTAAVRAARQVPGLAVQFRLETLIPLVLYPPAVARFLEGVFPDALADVDPLAAAAALVDRGAFVRMARARLALLHPSETADSVESWFRSTERRQVEVFLEREDFPVDAVLTPPPREADSSLFCPRCRTQYRSGTKRCTDCGDVTLVPYA